MTKPLIEEVAIGGKASPSAVECHDFAATEPQSRSRLRALYRGEKGAEAPAALCTARQRLSAVAHRSWMGYAFYLGNHTDGQALACYRGSKVGDLPGTGEAELAATSSTRGRLTARWCWSPCLNFASSRRPRGGEIPQNLTDR